MNLLHGVIILILVLQITLFAELNEHKLEKMGIDSTTILYFSYSDGNPRSHINGTAYGFRIIIKHDYEFIKYDYIIHNNWERKSVKSSVTHNVTCFLDSFQMAPIIDLINKLDFFSLPKKLPSDRTGSYSTLAVFITLGYRKNISDEIYIVYVETGAEGSYPGNTKNLFNQMRKLLGRIANDCSY